MAWSTFAECLLAAVGANSSLLVFPFQANYSSIVSPYNLDYPVTPAAVAFPHTKSQVSALVECAVESGYKVQPKSGGHSAANYGSSTGALSINLRYLQDFSIDSTTFRATVGSGMLLGEMDNLMYNSGKRFIPHGSDAYVGIGGHGTVGGAGYGWREYGLTIDHIQEVEVVLANATIARASATQNPDLFFAMLGAGASFGIVTEYVFNTLPAPSQTVSFTCAWNTTDTRSRAAIFKTWQAYAYNSSAPWAVETILQITNSSILMSGAYFGSLNDFNELGIPSLFPVPQISSTEVYTSFLNLSQLWAEETTESGRDSPAFFYTKSTVFGPETRIPDDIVDQVFEYIATTDSGAKIWDIEIQAGGGRNGVVSATTTAFPHRDAVFVFLLYAATTGKVTDQTTLFLDNLTALAKSGHPNAYYGEYAGFIDAKEDPDEARRRYWGVNLPRLERLKAAYDPCDVFHDHQSILPNGEYR